MFFDLLDFRVQQPSDMTKKTQSSDKIKKISFQYETTQLQLVT